MKLVVFAHTPPPHHGQSYMVQLMLEGFGGDWRKPHLAHHAEKYGITCYHINARLSRDLEDIGELRPAKILVLFGHCFSAIWCRLRHGAKTLYYIPAPGKRSALFRDWMVMFLCRPFFPKIILHWHAAGLSKWLETETQIRTRSFTYAFLKQVDMSIVLSRHNRADAEKLLPKNITLVPNGIPDPCPDFAESVWPIRRARQSARKKLRAGETVSDSEQQVCGDAKKFRVLYLAHCTRDKGVFDTIAGVLRANEKLAAEPSPLQIHLQIAGGFFNAAEEAEFKNVLAQPAAQKFIKYLGFVSGAQKNDALRNADLFCFPTYYCNENQPVNLIEAMAYGLPVLTTRWRSIPELLPQDYSGLVEIRSPEQVAGALIEMMKNPGEESSRKTFSKNFTLDAYLQNLADAFHAAENSAETAVLWAAAK